MSQRIRFRLVRPQFSLKTLFIAVASFLAGIAVQRWFADRDAAAVWYQEKLVRQYEKDVALQSDREIKALRRQMWDRQQLFEEAMKEMVKMLEDAYEGERRARQELLAKELRL